MKKIISALTTIGLSLMALVTLSFLAAPAATAGESPTIQICHATASETNPYNPITISKTAIVTGQGDQGHGSEHEGDIIPSFTYGDPLQTYPGKNWTEENKALYENSCVKPLTNVTPVAPTYAPGTCINPTGAVTLADQPEGVRLNYGPKLTGEGAGAAWTVSYVAEDGYKLASENAGTFTFAVVGPDTTDPNWDAEAGTCQLPNMGAGDLASYLPVAGGVIGAGVGLFIFSQIRRRKTA
jgi:hypothetical protein